MNGFALTIDGSPISAVTPGATPSSWLPAEDAPTGAGRLPALEAPKVEWQERCRVADGDLDVDGLTFTLHDLPGATGLAEGQPWLTYLTTRAVDDVPRAVLAAGFTDVATTFTLSDYGLIAGSFPCVLWIDEEAINCDSIDGSGVVTVASGGRGYYGTRAKAHTLDEELGAIPEVWTAPVWLQRRRVLLWRVVGNTATVIWRGYANRPRLAPDGASWQLQCEPAWTVDRGRPLGIPTAGTRIRGYNAASVAFGALTGFTLNQFGTSSTRNLVGTLIFSTLDELLSWAKARLYPQLLGVPGVTAAIVDLRRVRNRVTMLLQTSDMTNATLTAQISVAGEITSGPTSTSNPQLSSVEVEMPAVVLELPFDYDENAPPRIPVTSTNGLPTLFPLATTREDGAHTTTLQTTLAGNIDDNTLLVLYPIASSDDDAGIKGPTINAGYRCFDAKTGRVIDPRGTKLAPAIGGAIKILSAVRLQLGARISTTHWAYGLAALLEDSEHVNAGFDPRNFDTDSLDAVAHLTESEVSGREWNLDGSKTLGDLLVPTLAAEGCVPVIREYGRVGFAALRNPVANEAVDATFSATTDFVAGTRVEYEDSPAGVVNVAKVDVASDKITVRDVRSITRYGQGKVASFTLTGLEYAGDVTDARMVGSRLLSRVVQVLGDPVSLLRWTTHLGFFDTYAGSMVSLTDATSPNGAGGRGNSARRCQVIGRRVSLANGRVVLDALALPLAYAYAPAAKVASISGAVLTLDYEYVLEGALSGSTDYAGTTTGLAGDRGASKFAVGDRVKLIARDATTYTYYSGVVASIGTGVNRGKITLTASVPTSPDDWPTLCAGWVDVVYDDADTSGLQSAQLEYALCGSGSTVYGSIGSTGLPSRRWGA